MQKYKIIEEAIAQNDIATLREAVGSICYSSRDFSSGEFDEVVRYIESKGIKLKDDTLIGPPTISSQKNTFSEEDFTRAVFELKKNFCDERIMDVKHIGRTLYGSPKKADSSFESSSIDKNVEIENKRGTDPNLKSHLRRIIGIAIVCVVAVVVILLIIMTMNGSIQ